MRSARLEGGRMTEPTLSAVIVTHNSADVIQDCLKSVRLQLPDSEIVVVDNASGDDTRARCKEITGTTLVRNSANLGFGRACNQGVETATGSHVLFLNPDVELLAADLAHLRVEFAHEPFGQWGPSSAMARARHRFFFAITPGRWTSWVMRSGRCVHASFRRYRRSGCVAVRGGQAARP